MEANTRILTCLARENMVMGDEPATSPRALAHKPPPETSDLAEDNVALNPCNNLACRDFHSNVSLIHPETLSCTRGYKHSNEEIDDQFRAAALSKLPGSPDITCVSFQDISLGLLFALFGKYEGKQSHGAIAAKIIETNACFRGTTYTNDAEGAQKLRKTYTGHRKEGGLTTQPQWLQR